MHQEKVVLFKMIILNVNKRSPSFFEFVNSMHSDKPINRSNYHAQDVMYVINDGRCRFHVISKLLGQFIESHSIIYPNLSQDLNSNHEILKVSRKIPSIN